MEQYEQTTGKTLEELQPLPFPPFGAAVWHVWGKLCDSRQAGMSGPAALTYGEIESFSRMERWPLVPFEVRAIKMLDRVFRNVMSED